MPSSSLDDTCPCPHRILDDIGSSFVLGFCGGGMFHYLKGILNSPRDQPLHQRLYNGLTAFRTNAPRVGGKIAIWRCLLSVCECTMLSIRQKDDPWNVIVSGAVAGGLLQARQGLRSATAGAVLGGSVFVVLEVAEIMITKSVNGKRPQQVSLNDEDPRATFGNDAGKTWLFFDGSDGLESFDSPDPPRFDS